MPLGKTAVVEVRTSEDVGACEKDRARSISAEASHSAPYVWYVIGLLFLVNVFNYIDRMALAVLLPGIKADLTLTDGQLGLLTGVAFSIFYAIFGIPIARWADRGNRRNIVAISLAAWSMMTALCGAAQSFWHLFIARMGVGVGEAGGLAPAQAMICDYVPFRKRAGAYAIHAFGLIVGLMIGMGLSGWLAEAIGWRWTFVALGLPGIALAIVVRLTLREPLRGAFDMASNREYKVSLARTIKLLWSCRSYRFLLLFSVANGFLQFALFQWWPSFYARVFGLSLSSIGAYLGTAIGVGSGAGLLIGGLVANKLASRDVRLPLVVGAAASVLVIPAALGTLFSSSLSHSILFVALTALLWSVPNPAAVATLYSVVTPHMRAMAGAMTTFMTSMVGFSLGPLCVGLLSDALAPALGAESLRYALVAPLGALLPMIAVLWAASRTLSRDLKVGE